MTDPTSPTPPDQPAHQAGLSQQPPPIPPGAGAPPPAGQFQGATLAGPPSPAAPAKRSNARALIVGGTALVLAICCGGAVIGALNGADDEKPKSIAATSASPSSAAPTTAAPTTAAPTSAAPTSAAPATTEPAPTTAAPTPKPKVIKGRGDDLVRIPELADLAVVKFTCKCTSNTVLKSDGDGLLVNEIGSYSGKRWINLEDGSLTTQFEIEASGSWTLTIGTVAQMASKFPTGKASGKGDDVLVLGGDATAAKITHRRGSSNFVVYAYSLETGEGGLLVNEIGGYSGVRPLSAPALVQITADGNWTIAPA
ncbi:hypothetical protein ABZ570_16190 [Micromonospora sp. NPDC007271]|uniref:hypothetical protein n=1 Tax=Micromonospora sp. NPDC007271 TaxID=3154587 RepID=UPI00340AD77E